MSLSEAEIKKQSAQILKQLRQNAGGISPETIAQAAKDKKLKIGAQTIRSMEKPGRHNPRIVSLMRLLTYYGITLGDFYRFTLNEEDGRRIGRFVRASRGKKDRDALDTVMESILSRDGEA